MIVLTVISFNGVAVQNTTASFDEIGGTIGRANTNQLVLPDTERSISRVHAQVVFRAGRYALVDRGSNAVIHNGQAIGNGREVLLVVGDEVQIGGYLIRVSTDAAAKSLDPFGDFDGIGSVLASQTTSKSNSELPVPGANMAHKVAQVSAMPVSAPRAVAGIPEDWDPFKPDPASIPSGFNLESGHGLAAQGVAGTLPNAFTADVPVVGRSNEQSLDALFGLGGGTQSGDPLTGSSLLAPQVQPNTSANADPMRALLQQTAPSVVTAHDHDSDLQSPWHDTPLVNNPQPFGGTSSATPAALAGAVLSWEQSAIAVAPIQRPLVSPRLNQPAATSSQVAPDPKIPSPASAIRSSEVAPTVVAPEAEELLHAFLRGLMVPDLRLRTINADAMFQLGQMLRESTKGTVELLAARTALKQEVRADVTVMVTNSNNALKFSPTVEFALQYLLGPPTVGFMGPVDSMRDAYDNLKAHQLGVMAGMRAALSDVLKRFDPSVLEGKLAARASWTNIIPSRRKARLWELFQELFGQLAGEAEEDFDELFSNAFAREYERYVAQLKTNKQS